MPLLVYAIVTLQTEWNVMTAEERMAYFQGEKRRSQSIAQSGREERNVDLIFLKIKFFIAVVLFILFLSLDYTGYRFYGYGSEEIIQEVTADLELPQKLTNDLFKKTV